MTEDYIEMPQTKNTDRELFREITGEYPSDYYENSIHVTEDGLIGMSVGGTVYVMSIADWHALYSEDLKRKGAFSMSDGHPKWVQSEPQKHKPNYKRVLIVLGLVVPLFFSIMVFVGITVGVFSAGGNVGGNIAFVSFMWLCWCGIVACAIGACGASGSKLKELWYEDQD